MKLVVLGLAGLLAAFANPAAAQANRRPNVVILLGDDLGFSGLGSFSSKAPGDWPVTGGE